MAREEKAAALTFELLDSEVHSENLQDGQRKRLPCALIPVNSPLHKIISVFFLALLHNPQLTSGVAAAGKSTARRPELVPLLMCTNTKVHSGTCPPGSQAGLRGVKKVKIPHIFFLCKNLGTPKT